MKKIWIAMIIITILVSLSIIAVSLPSEPDLDVTVTGKTSTGNDGLDIYTIPPQSPMNFLQLNAKVSYIGIIPYEYHPYCNSLFNVEIHRITGNGAGEYEYINITNPFLGVTCPFIQHHNWIIDDQRTFTWNFTQYIPDPEKDMHEQECIIVPVDPGLYRLEMNFYGLDHLYNFKIENT